LGEWIGKLSAVANPPLKNSLYLYDVQQCLGVMANLFGKILSSLPLRVLLIWVITIFVTGELIELSEDRFGLSDRIGDAIVVLILLNGLFVYAWSGTIGKVPVPDRHLVWRAHFWVWGPFVPCVIFLFILYCFYWEVFLVPLLFGLFAILTFFFVWTWGLISEPFAESWVFQNAKCPETRPILEKLEKEIEVKFPAATDLTEMQIEIAPKLYYRIIAIMGAMLFIICETVIAEFLGNFIGSGGYIGATIVAFGIAALFYPMHKRATNHFSFENTAEDNSQDSMSLAMRIRDMWRVLTGIIPRLYLPFAVGGSVGLLLAYWFDKWIGS